MTTKRKPSRLDKKLPLIKTLQKKRKRAKRKKDKAEAEIRETEARQKELKVEIVHAMIQKEHPQRLTDPIQDYCFRSYHDIDGIYKAIDLIKEFKRQIREAKGQRILIAKGKTEIVGSTLDRRRIATSLETGIILGTCEFSVENTFRYLHVPVRNHMQFSRDEWVDRDNRGEILKPKIWISNRFFEERANYPTPWQIKENSDRHHMLYMGDDKVKKAIEGYDVFRTIEDTPLTKE